MLPNGSTVPVGCSLDGFFGFVASDMYTLHRAKHEINGQSGYSTRFPLTMLHVSGSQSQRVFRYVGNRQ